MMMVFGKKLIPFQKPLVSFVIHIFLFIALDLRFYVKAR